MAVTTGVRLGSDNADEIPDPPRRSIFRRGFDYAADAINGGVDFVNREVSDTFFGRFFRLRGSGHPDEIREANFCTEIKAGLITFSAMVYLLAANPAVIASAGYECSCLGEDKGKPTCLMDYQTCIEELRRDMVTVTAAVTAISCILFGLMTNMPVAPAPGMGLNSYFSYQVIGVRGTGNLPWRMALTAVFVEGWVFIILALTGARNWLVRIIPRTMKIAGICGIGLFLTLTGLAYNTGLGIIAGGNAVPISLADCRNLDQHGDCSAASPFANPKVWLGILGGGILPTILMGYNSMWSIGVGVLFVTLVSIPRSTPVTFFPYDSVGQNKWDYFSSMVGVRRMVGFDLDQLRFDIPSHLLGNFIVAVITMLYVDMIDCTATLQAFARITHRTPGSDPDFPGSTMAYCTNAFCISMAALLGSSPVTPFVESGAGVMAGGRTGLTAIVTGLCFLAAVFLSPFFSGIPPWATGPALVLTGFLMMRQIGSINWNYAGDAVPSFITIMFIPFSYSVAYGLIAGLFAYIIVNGLMWAISKVTGVMPHDYHLKQEWTINPGGREPWMFRAYKWIKAKLEKNRQTTEEVPVQEFELMEREVSRPRSAVASASTVDDKNSRRAQSPDHLRSD